MRRGIFGGLPALPPLLLGCCSTTSLTFAQCNVNFPPFGQIIRCTAEEIVDQSPVVSMVGFAAPVRKVKLYSIKECSVRWEVTNHVRRVNPKHDRMIMRKDGCRVLSGLLVRCMMSLLVFQYSCRQLDTDIGKTWSDCSRMAQIAVANNEQRFDLLAIEGVPRLSIGVSCLGLFVLPLNGAENNGGRAPILSAGKSS